MARLVLTPASVADIERLADFLLESDLDAAAETGDILIDGLRILKQHPLVGKPAAFGYRELLISRGRSGYVALYKFDVMADRVTIYTIRHQREGGYPRR